MLQEAADECCHAAADLPARQTHHTELAENRHAGERLHADPGATLHDAHP
jgi:hypothetical protein